MPTLADTSFQPPFGLDARADWPLDFSVAFLNHGSFGSVPHDVHAAAELCRQRVEAHPVDWFIRRAPEALRKAATDVAHLLGALPQNTGFVANASAAANAVLRDIPLEKGDEILLLDQGYNAVKQTALHAAAQRGAVVREVKVPLPLLDGPMPVVAALEAAITHRTRLAILDQVTSPTALVLPIEKMVAVCTAKNVPVFVDGAHAPGMLETPAAIEGASWWTGNLHKWLCAPKGCAVLVVREDLATTQHAPVISHGYNESYAEEFDWQGTRDLAPWLAAPAAIEFWNRYGGLQSVRERNHACVITAQEYLLDRFQTQAYTPADGSMLASMATLPLPEPIKHHPDAKDCLAMNGLLFERFKVEVPVLEVGDDWATRISAQVYNAAEDYERLADAIQTLCDEASVS